MNDLQKKLKPYAPLFLRLGLGIVFLIFGYQKLSLPGQTRAEIQLLLDIGLGSASAINFYLGLTEVIVGLSFIFGIYVKKSALVGSFLLLGFFSSFLWKYGLSVDPTLYRDLGLLGGSISLYIQGAGYLSFDNLREEKVTPLP